jgi:hypothetical protein
MICSEIEQLRYQHFRRSPRLAMAAGLPSSPTMSISAGLAVSAGFSRVALQP